MDHIMPGIRARIILHARQANWAQNIQIKNTHTIAIVCLHVLNSVQECMNVLTKLEFLIDPTLCVFRVIRLFMLVSVSGGPRGGAALG